MQFSIDKLGERLNPSIFTQIHSIVSKRLNGDLYYVPERDVVYELEGQLFVWDRIKADSNKAKHGISFEEAASVTKTLEKVICMKAEYDFSTMKRKGHPLRKKVSQGELKLISPLDIPDKEAKLAKLTPSERVFITGLLDPQRIKP